MWAVLLILVTIIVFARAAAAGARDTVLEEGKQDFAENCVACHGADAKGTGDLSKHLIRTAKDLTRISTRHNGDFPFWRVFEIIAGEKEVEGHATFQMPRYSKRMRGDDFMPGYLPSHVRVLELTHYLEGIQERD